MNMDIMLLNIEDIITSVKECIKYSSSIDYIEDYEKNVYELLEILNSANLIKQEILRKSEI